jgi:L-asparaginase/Glu-tRNA(Gln) amidotransferase subunit D
MSALREACERGVVIVAITQCAKGSVSKAYHPARTLLQAGVVPGGDMTPEVRTLVARNRRKMKITNERHSFGSVLFGSVR